MIAISELQTVLLDILFKLKGTDIKLILGGGFGIYLKREYIRRLGTRTLLSVLPEARSTNDLDLFLRPEFIIKREGLKPLKAVLDSLEFQPIIGAEYYQFSKPRPKNTESGIIKIDILTGPKSYFTGTEVKVDSRRVKPNPSIGLHAHVVNEAPTLLEKLLPITISGKMSSGEKYKDAVLLPHPFTFLMMKLFAFKDRYDDPDKEFGRYHALDLYTILATTTEDEWDDAKRLAIEYESNPFVKEAGQIVEEYFSTMSGMGIIRLKENTYYRPELQLVPFISALQELFPHKSL